MCISSQHDCERYRTILNVDLDAICHNGMIDRETFKNQKIMCVLKADAYGHGICGVLPAYERFADAYAVATLEEGLQIRKVSSKPVLIFGPLPADQMVQAAQAGLTFTVGCLEYARRLSERLLSAGLKGRCHLKIDTGLNRSGISAEEVSEVAAEIYALEALEFTGTYTHFACGEGRESWDLAFTKRQFERFQTALDRMRKKGFPVGICHCCSTGGALVHPEYRMDMVRVGMMPLGMSYNDRSVSELGLKPAAQWVSFIAQIKFVSKGESIGYCCSYYAKEDMQVALVTCGYADGYRRVYSNKTVVCLHGQTAPVVGRVAMDYILINVTHIPDVQVGDRVVLLGSDGDISVSAQQLAQYGESVSGEVTCAISARVPRVYLGG